MPRLDIKFKELSPGRIINTGEDNLTVNAVGLRLSQKAYARMGYPETVAVGVSEDRRAVRLSVPGPFHVRTISEKGKVRGGAMVNAVVIPRSADKGTYAHVDENLFLHE